MRSFQICLPAEEREKTFFWPFSFPQQMPSCEHQAKQMSHRPILDHHFRKRTSYRSYVSVFPKYLLTKRIIMKD